MLTLTMFYGVLWLLPQEYFFRRPALYFYAKFWFIFRFICFVGGVMTNYSETEDIGGCIYTFGVSLFFGLLKPRIVYRTLLKDSDWWQGVGEFAPQNSKHLPYYQRNSWGDDNDIYGYQKDIKDDRYFSVDDNNRSSFFAPFSFYGAALEESKKNLQSSKLISKSNLNWNKSDIYQQNIQNRAKNINNNLTIDTKNNSSSTNNIFFGQSLATTPSTRIARSRNVKRQKKRKSDPLINKRLTPKIENENGTFASSSYKQYWKIEPPSPLYTNNNNNNHKLNNNKETLSSSLPSPSVFSEYGESPRHETPSISRHDYGHQINEHQHKKNSIEEEHRLNTKDYSPTLSYYNERNLLSTSPYNSTSKIFSYSQFVNGIGIFKPEDHNLNLKRSPITYLYQNNSKFQYSPMTNKYQHNNDYENHIRNNSNDYERTTDEFENENLKPLQNQITPNKNLIERIPHSPSLSNEYQQNQYIKRSNYSKNKELPPLPLFNNTHDEVKENEREFSDDSISNRESGLTFRSTSSSIVFPYLNEEKEDRFQKSENNLIINTNEPPSLRRHETPDFQFQPPKFTDSKHKQVEASLTKPLLGIDIRLKDAQDLADLIDQLPVQVKLLNFAYLKLNNEMILGGGSNAKVYAGKWKNTSCAVKLLFTLDITKDTIRRICTEATILSGLSHPNIVGIFGVSVLPPSICLVLELCELKSLTNVLTGYNNPPQFPIYHGLYRLHHHLPLNLSWSDKIYLAFGCACGIAALHSVSPTLCHRDIKSQNFLIDGQMVVKIADLELGGSFSENMTFDTDFFNCCSCCFKSQKNNNVSRTKKRRRSARSKTRTLSRVEYDPPDETKMRDSNEDIEENGYFEEIIPEVANWLPPEVLKGEKFTQKSDVYSLGMVFYEILAGSVPFDELLSQIDVKKAILSGNLPSLKPYYPSGYTFNFKKKANRKKSLDQSIEQKKDEFHSKYGITQDQFEKNRIKSSSIDDSFGKNDVYDYVDVRFLKLIKSTWSSKPKTRPTSIQMARKIENLYFESLLPLISKDNYLLYLQKKLEVEEEEKNEEENKNEENEHNIIESPKRSRERTSTSSPISPDRNLSGSRRSTSSPTRRSRSDYFSSPAYWVEPSIPLFYASLRETVDWSIMESDGRAYVVTNPTPPYKIVYVTKTWATLTGYSKSYATGKSLNMLNGPDTNLEIVARMDNDLIVGVPAHILIFNYTRSGVRFFNSLHSFPLYVEVQDDEAKYCVHIFSALDWGES